MSACVSWSIDVKARVLDQHNLSEIRSRHVSVAASFKYNPNVLDVVYEVWPRLRRWTSDVTLQTNFCSDRQIWIPNGPEVQTFSERYIHIFDISIWRHVCSCSDTLGHNTLSSSADVFTLSSVNISRIMSRM